MNEESMCDFSLDQQQDYRQLIFQEYCELFEKKRQECLTHIHVVIQYLREGNFDQKNSLLIQYLNLMLETQSPKSFPEKYKAVSTRITEIIKQAISTSLAETHEKQGDFYQATAQFNTKLAQMSNCRDKQWLKLLQDPKILMKIDLLPYFFYYNHEYKQNSYLDIPLWSGLELGAIQQIRGSYIRYLYLYNVKFSKLLDFKPQNMLNSLISAFALARFIVKVGNVHKQPRQQYANIYKERSKKVAKNQEETATSSDSTFSVPYKFRLSELGIFAREKQINLLPMLKKEHITNHINSIVSSTSQTQKKQHIFILRMKFHVPFHIVAHMVSNIQQHQVEKNETFFEQNLHKDMKCLQCKIKYIFTCELSPAKALQRLNLQKDFNTKVNYLWRIAHCRSDVTSCFVKATLSNFKKYYESTFLLLQLENLIKPILAVKKFYFSYKQVTGSTDQSEEDLISTFIIGTQGNKVIFYHVSRQKLSKVCFLNKLKEIIVQSYKRLPQAVVLFQHQMGNPFKWLKLVQFINFIYKNYNSRVYVCNQHSFCRINITLYIYTLECLKGLAPLITKEGFFVFVENYVKQTILLYNQTEKMTK